MPLYVADYLADTGHLSVSEHGAYLLLIMHYWQHGSLPSDETRLARIARMTREQWAESRDVLAEFFEDGWRHSRIDSELQAASEKYERRAAAGRKGGNAKAADKQCSSNAKANDQALLNQPQPQPQSNSSELDDKVVRLSEADLAFAAWNEMAAEAGLPICQRISQTRRSAMHARLKECGGIEGWKTAMDKVRDSPFLRGANDKGWRADIDFVLQAKSFTRLMEGFYDERPGQNAKRHAGKPNGFDAFLAAAGGALDRGQWSSGDGREFPADGSDIPPACLASGY